jgi:putative Holliday junction resolvase
MFNRKNILMMGFDYGTKHIGIAIGQTLTATASPLATISVRNQKPDWKHLNELIYKWQPQALIVGLPQHLDGSNSSLTDGVNGFIEELKQRYRLPVHTIDETLSSVEAARKSHQAHQKKDNKNINAIAAQVILESWIADNNCKPTHTYF